MFPTIPLTDFTQKWRDAIKNNAAISDFCMTNYGKSLTLYVGINGKKPPDDENCPLIIVFPGGKTEGISESEYHYTGSIGWSIIQSNVTKTENTTENDGIYEADALGQLILLTIAELNPSHPINRVDYSFESNDFFPQFPGRMDITIEIPLTMGAQITY